MAESTGRTDQVKTGTLDAETNGERLTRRAPPPAGLAPLRFAFGVIGRMLPGPMSAVAYRLWFRTRRFPLRDHEREVLGRATRDTIDVGSVPVAVYSWGQGPTVMLVHGWHGSAANFAAFVDPLVNAGFRALTFDAPAHGATPGTETTIYEIAASIDAIVARHGPIDTVITHSFGAPCVLMSIEKGLKVRRAVCISPPAEVSGLLEAFVETLNLPQGVVQRFRGRLEREFGADIWQRLSPARLVRGLDLPALIVHDRHDRAMLYEEGETLARIWPKAEFHGTSGLGHNRILIDPAVIARVIAFLKNQG